MAKPIEEKAMRNKVAKLISDGTLEFEVEEGQVVFLTDFWQDLDDEDMYVLGEPSTIEDDAADEEDVLNINDDEDEDEADVDEDD